MSDSLIGVLAVVVTMAYHLPRKYRWRKGEGMAKFIELCEEEGFQSFL